MSAAALDTLQVRGGTLRGHVWRAPARAEPALAACCRSWLLGLSAAPRIEVGR